MGKQKAIIFDIDNVLFDVRIPDLDQPTDRNDVDAWRAWQPRLAEGKPIEVMTKIRDSITKFDPSIVIIYVTSREATEEVVKITFDQLSNNLTDPLYMRKERDTRPAYEVKEKFLHEIMEEYDVVLALDDCNNNIAMYKRNGIDTLQFRFGDN